MEQPDGRYAGKCGGGQVGRGGWGGWGGLAGRCGNGKWAGRDGWMMFQSANPPVRPPTVVPAGHSAVLDQSSCHPTNGSCNLQTGNYTVFISAKEIEHEQSL